MAKSKSEILDLIDEECSQQGKSPNVGKVLKTMVDDYINSGAGKVFNKQPNIPAIVDPSSATAENNATKINSIPSTLVTVGIIDGE